MVMSIKLSGKPNNDKGLISEGRVPTQAAQSRKTQNPLSRYKRSFRLLNYQPLKLMFACGDSYLFCVHMNPCWCIMQRDNIAIGFPFEMHNMLERFSPALRSNVSSNFSTVDDMWLEF